MIEEETREARVDSMFCVPPPQVADHHLSSAPSRNIDVGGSGYPTNFAGYEFSR
jgi:hypothetical protein